MMVPACGVSPAKKAVFSFFEEPIIAKCQWTNCKSSCNNKALLVRTDARGNLFSTRSERTVRISARSGPLREHRAAIGPPGATTSAGFVCSSRRFPAQLELPRRDGEKEKGREGEESRAGKARGRSRSPAAGRCPPATDAITTCATPYLLLKHPD
jgi:hypothetical protein